MIRLAEETPRDALRGFIPILPTIFNKDETIDEDGIRSVVRYLVRSGANGTTIHANSSEGYALADDERDQVQDIVLDEAGGRLPVVVTVNHYSTEVACRRARGAREAGASAIMALPPFFGSMAADAAGVHGFFARLAEAAAEVPLIVQDDPALSGFSLTPEFVARLAKDVPGVKYLKLESPQAPHRMDRIKNLLGDRIQLFGGMGGLVFLEELERGAIGTMPSAALLEMGTVYRLYVAGKYLEARHLFYSRCLPYINFEIRLALKNITKEVLAMANIIRDPSVRHPWPGSYDSETKRQLKQLITELNLDVFKL